MYEDQWLDSYWEDRLSGGSGYDYDDSGEWYYEDEYDRMED